MLQSNKNSSVTVNLCPPHVWPEFFTSFNTLSDEFPLVSGLAIISWSPPSKPDKLPASSKLDIKDPAVTVELPETNNSISSKWYVPVSFFPPSIKKTSFLKSAVPSKSAPGLGHACCVTVEKSKIKVCLPFLRTFVLNSL